MIPYGRQCISEEDIQAVNKVLRSDYLTQGGTVTAFEQKVADYCGAKHGVAVNSATSALHLACLALGLKEGGRLWTSSISFVASANCGIYCGAAVDFVDIDRDTFNLCIVSLEKKLKEAELTGDLPDVLVVVHLAGQSCKMKEIKLLCDPYGIKIIEDASHAIGGKYESFPVGSCRYSDITVFSFHPVKIITTAEGGVAVTNSPELAEQMELLRSHGVTRDPVKMEGDSDGEWYYQQIALGFNYRMTELQAALGCSQMESLDYFVSKREEYALKYNDCLAGLPLALPVVDKDCQSAWHLYIVRLQGDTTEVTRKDLFDYLRQNGVGVNVHYIPIHTQPYYQSLRVYDDLFEAERYYSEALSLPLYPGLGDKSQDYIIDQLKGYLG